MANRNELSEFHRYKKWTKYEISILTIHTFIKI